MKVSANQNNISPLQDFTGVKNLYTQKLSDDEAKELRKQVVENANAYMFESTSVQSNLSTMKDNSKKDYEEFQSFLKDVGYSGKPIAELSKDEASALVSEDGIFGIKQTSERIANFVINGAGGDEKLLRAGREGMLSGFKQAEEMWGGKLPEISQITMQKATEMVDMAMNDLGFSILNQEA
ncbi:MAG: hypothetical protein PHU40_04800 [Sulfurimonas sp.]|nr:hypothetical protein [Sulfurimonas sp.]